VSRCTLKGRAFPFLIVAALLSSGGGSLCLARQPSVNRSAVGDDWPMVAGDLGSTRYSSLSIIRRDNVSALGGAWFHKFENDPVRGTPVVVHGRMYVASTDHVSALDAKTGLEIWSTKLSTATIGFYKGVTLGEGLVFVGLGDSRVVALDENTGQQIWSVKIGDATPPYGQYISGAPAYAAGLLLVGLANGDVPGVRGRLVALDAKTGMQVWRFNSISDRGGKGSETWPQDRDEWRPGGGGIWITPAIDEELGLAYVPVGNATPQWGGEIRAGNNLYTASIVALDLKTGELRWYFQVIHHDMWDSDLATPPILYDAVVGGKPRKAVGFVSTYGYLFMLDRKDGSPIWPIEERPVPQNARLHSAATQPFPVRGERVGNRCVTKDAIPSGFRALCEFDPVDYDMPNAMYPFATMRAAPMAFDPTTRQFYGTGAVWPYWAKRLEDPRTWVQAWVPGVKRSGILVALDSTTNKLAWQKFVPWQMHQNGSGFIATAGKLLFHGNTDGNFDAYDEHSGERLWQFQTGSSANQPAATYAIDGVQYVAINSADGVWAFKLGGALKPMPASSKPPVDLITYSGRVVPTDKITMSQVVPGLPGSDIKSFDEYAFQPQRAKATVGSKVTWTNSGKLPHAAKALDGSWSTGVIAPGISATLTFDKPGTYTYIDSLNPWTYGEITIEK
jgi:quinohemoprotein ethanol dehydrogenase